VCICINPKNAYPNATATQIVHNINGFLWISSFSYVLLSRSPSSSPSLRAPRRRLSLSPRPRRAARAVLLSYKQRQLLTLHHPFTLERAVSAAPSSSPSPAGRPRPPRRVGLPQLVSRSIRCRPCTFSSSSPRPSVVIVELVSLCACACRADPHALALPKPATGPSGGSGGGGGRKQHHHHHTIRSHLPYKKPGGSRGWDHPLSTVIPAIRN
jgi:hypothetical protein